MSVHNREAYRNGINGLLQLQRKLKRPPHRAQVTALVLSLIKQFELKHDPRLRFFTLLATCALLGKEPMYNAFDPKPKRRKV